MKIEQNKVVSLVYELREDNREGRIIESLDENKPLTFIFGTGRLLPAFESNLETLGSGDSFSFLLNAESAYGDRREDLVIDIPIQVFKTDGDQVNEEICRVGNEVPMMDNQGNHISGIINEIHDDFVKMDFNHPMAGANLYFTGKITEVREASTEELEGSNHSCSSCNSHDKTSCGGNCN